MAREGARVALVDRQQSLLEIAERELRASEKLDIIGVTADVTSRTDVRRAVGDVLKKWDRVDILVAAAGITGKTNVKTHEVDPDVRSSSKLSRLQHTYIKEPL